MKKIVRKFLQGCSLTAAMFVFQACYGTDEHYYPGYRLQMVFHVLDENDNAIDGIRLKSFDSPDRAESWYRDHGYSNTEGVVVATAWSEEMPYTTFRFEDEQGRFEHLDTIFSNISESDTIDITLKVKRNGNE